MKDFQFIYNVPTNNPFIKKRIIKGKCPLLGEGNDKYIPQSKIFFTTWMCYSYWESFDTLKEAQEFVQWVYTSQGIALMTLFSVPALVGFIFLLVYLSLHIDIRF